MDGITQALKSVSRQDLAATASGASPRADCSQQEGPRVTIPEPHQRALSLWLEWNDAHEKLAEAMFQEGSDQRAIEAALDATDRLRQEAVELTRRIVESQESRA